jgi:cell fate regulator YaaT (PSP1 superfamily)
MAEVIGVRFKNTGKVYYFDPAGETVEKGEMVIVETARGLECGETAMENRDVNDESIVQPLRKLIRKATKEDLKKVEENRKKEASAFVACEKKIADHGLEMKLVDVEYTFDNSKILFYFTADGRVDFRELVKDLAGLFRTRIELRQIGVRDEAKMLGGIGICGRPFCCGTFLGGFQPVSIKMAKEQGLSLNPVKISGTCGRLMCCLKYEQEAYQDLLRNTPKVNALVSTPEGKGVVIDQNLLTRKLTVRMDKDPEGAPKVFKVNEVKLLRDGKIKVEKKELEELKALEETK